MNLSSFAAIECLLPSLILLLYATGTATIVVGMLARNEKLKQISGWLTVAGFVVHTVVLILGHSAITWDNLPRSYVFQLMSWAMVLIYFIVWWKYKLAFLSALVSPFALVIYLSSFSQSNTQSQIPESLSGLFFGLHVGSLSISFALMLMACGAGIIFLYLEKKIKNKEPLTGFRKDLPALSTCDKLNRLSVMWGFPLFTLGMISGFVWAHPAWGKVISWDPKEIVSMVLWLLYAVLFHHRIALGWQGRKAATMAIWIFAISVFSLLIVNTFMPTHHSFTQQ